MSYHGCIRCHGPLDHLGKCFICDKYRAAEKIEPTNTLQTLKELIIAAKCRKGKAHAISAEGAYWLAIPPIRIRRYGGEGIGQSAPDVTNYLELRHFRSGLVVCTVVIHSWHQNRGSVTSGRHCSLDNCASVEEVVAALKVPIVDGHAAFSDRLYDELSEPLMELGLFEFPPGPDEEPEEGGAA